MIWRPIKTCPKDGTEFLAYDARSKRYDVCVWRPEFGVCQTQLDSEFDPAEGEFGHERGGITLWAEISPPE